MLQILDNTITMQDGLYSLNDLHRASGEEDKHRPTFFLRNDEVKELIAELKAENARCANSHIKEPVRVVKGIQSNGMKQGTYVCKELVYRYAMWVSAKFQLLVIRSFDLMTNQHIKLSDRVNHLCQSLNHLDNGLSHAGRFLCVGGKQVKPELIKEIDRTMSQLQPSLFECLEVQA